MGRYGGALALAGAVIIGLAGPAAAQKVAFSTDLDAGPQAADPAKRDKLLLPFGKRLWRPIKGQALVAMPDDQMAVVGLNEATRIYARAGGGGGGPKLEWAPGEVFVRVAPGKYLALEPIDQPRTPPPALGPDPRGVPAPKPQR